jgi:hypothetical protein
MSQRASRHPERGQVLPLVLVLLPVLVVFAGLVLDFGSAYLMKGRLQAATDAAALAGAQRLPDAGAATTDAIAYGSQSGSRNADPGLSGVTTDVDLGCVAPSRFCSPDDPATSNAVTVDQQGSFETSFLRLFGFDSISLHTRATACSPCGARPLDIMVVLDRTGSMCTPKAADGSCIDLDNAREGVKTFLGLMDPTSDAVGLTVLPPAVSTNCGASDGSYESSRYVLVPLSTDYRGPAGLNSTSQLVTTIECLQSGGATAYATAIDKAQDALESQGRSDAQHVIVFLSDGAANTKVAPYSDVGPCQAGVEAASAAKSEGTAIYTIGYDLDGLTGVPEPCQDASLPDAKLALTLMASTGADGLPNFYNKPDPGQLNGIFRRIAADIGQGTSRLVG